MNTHLGRYEIIETVGRGSIGVVYKARDPLLDRLVAVKAISLQALSSEERARYEARFYQEAKAAARLNHPNLVTIYDLGETGDTAYIAMELLEGRDLEKVKNLSVDETLNLAIQAASGLFHAHQHGIVHRDIKPANMMLLRNNQLKICDFGVARMTSSIIRTQAGAMLGSPMYMSPEQVRGATVDSRSDIFSLGIVLQEMLTGQNPFSGDNTDVTMQNIVETLPPRPSSLNPGVPPMLDDIVLKCLAKRPADRYRNAGELESDLRLCRGMLLQTQTGVPHHRHYFLGNVGGYARRVDRWKAAVIVALIVAITAIASIGLYELIRQLFFR